MLGKTGIRFPVIGMGMLLSGNVDLMQAALDAGITHFDTTGGRPQQERNEAMIGEVLKGRPRESFIFGPKIHLPRNQITGLYEKEATAEEFLKKLDKMRPAKKASSISKKVPLDLFSAIKEAEEVRYAQNGQDSGDFRFSASPSDICISRSDLRYQSRAPD